jgi:hypothetical protein
MSTLLEAEVANRSLGSNAELSRSGLLFLFMQLSVLVKSGDAADVESLVSGQALGTVLWQGANQKAWQR